MYVWRLLHAPPTCAGGLDALALSLSLSLSLDDGNDDDDGLRSWHIAGLRGGGGGAHVKRSMWCGYLLLTLGMRKALASMAQ